MSAPRSATELEADSVARRAPGQVASAPPGSARRLDGPSVLPGRGRPLDPGLRSAMESRTGADLSRVRVRTGSQGARAADALGARAVSAGPDIAFARGAYDPASTTGRRLIAHELAHTLQPAGSGPAVRRQPRGPVTAGVDPSVVELKGHGRFDPPVAIAEKIKANGLAPTWVSVRFGTIAAGEIPVRWGPRFPLSMSLTMGYQTPEPEQFMPAWGIALHHPAFRTHPLARPTLFIEIRDSVVGGALGWVTSLGLAMDLDRFKQSVPLNERLRGLRDFSDVDLPDGEKENSLRNGHLRYEIPRLTFRSDPFEGEGTMTIRDETYQLDAGIPVVLPGLPSGTKVPVREDQRSADAIFVRERWKFARDLGAGRGRLAGSLSVTVGHGHVDIRGKAHYANTKPNVTGEVTIVVGSMDVAQEVVRDKLGQAAPASDATLAGGGLAITGWGDLDFDLSEWINGRASVVVHPEGYVTASGELTPTKVFVLSPYYEKERRLKRPFSDEKTVPIAGFGKLAGFNATVNWTTDVKASFGPVALHDIRLKGLVSTHPGIVNTFELAAVVSAPATAGLALTVSGGFAGHLLGGKAISAELTGKGGLDLLMYAEVPTQVGRRPETPSASGPLSVYYLEGSIAASAELLLRLDLELRGKLLFWSGTKKLLDREWSLGRGGVGLDFTYVLGGPQKDHRLETKFQNVDFDGVGFARAIGRRELAKAKGAEEPQQVTAETESNVDRQEAPPVESLPGAPGAPPPAATSVTATRHLEEPFVMGTQQHVLHLELAQHPDVLMASRRPTSLLWRIKRVRSELRKTPPPPAELQTRLEDLAKIEEQAQLVLAAASAAVKDPRYLTPDIAGFRQLAELIEVYAHHYGATDLEAALAAVSVDPDDPATILGKSDGKFKDLAAKQVLVSRLADLLNHGVSAVHLRTVVEHHGPRQKQELEDLLYQVWNMVTRDIQGWRSVFADLVLGGNKLKGARFVLAFVENEGSWDNLRFEVKDEEADDPDGRRWDAWMEGTLYEFKAWYAWKPINDATFLKQIRADHIRAAGMPLVWMFGPGAMKRDDVLRHMRAALTRLEADLRAGRKPKAEGYTIALANEIEQTLDEIVKKRN